MDKDTILERLRTAGLAIASDTRNGNDNGWAIRLDNGAIVNVWDSGKITFQGQNQEAARTALNLNDPAALGGAVSSATTTKNARRVFVVYSHDPTPARLDAMLRRWQVEPLFLDQLPSGGQTIIEKLESVRRDANFDDEGYARVTLAEEITEQGITIDVRLL